MDSRTQRFEKRDIKETNKKWSSEEMLLKLEKVA